eukprot:4493877-Amphidinium_carterae.2
MNSGATNSKPLSLWLSLWWSGNVAMQVMSVAIGAQATRAKDQIMITGTLGEDARLPELGAVWCAARTLTSSDCSSSEVRFMQQGRKPRRWIGLLQDVCCAHAGDLVTI